MAGLSVLTQQFQADMSRTAASDFAVFVCPLRHEPVGVENPVYRVCSLHTLPLTSLTDNPIMLKSQWTEQAAERHDAGGLTWELTDSTSHRGYQHNLARASRLHVRQHCIHQPQRTQRIHLCPQQVHSGVSRACTHHTRDRS